MANSTSISTTNGRKFYFAAVKVWPEGVTTEELMIELTERMQKNRNLFKKLSSDLMDEVQNQLIEECAHYT